MQHTSEAAVPGNAPTLAQPGEGKTEKQKVLAEELYWTADDGLELERQNARRLPSALNALAQRINPAAASSVKIPLSDRPSIFMLPTILPVRRTRATVLR